MIDGPPERDARVLGSRHKILCNEWAPKEAEICFPDAPCLDYELPNYLALKSLVATSPSPFRNIMPANGRLHTGSLLFHSMAALL
jgi:hypothetical protein